MGGFSWLPWPTLGLSSLLVACAGPGGRPPVRMAVVPVETVQEPDTAPWTPPPPAPDGADWIRLSSGEWLKGEIEALTRDSLEFDSEELDKLSLDWSDVAEVRTGRPFTVVLRDRTTLTGSVEVRDGEMLVRTADQEVRVDRADLFRMVPGREGEWSRWSGKLGLGVTYRSGNTDQTDLTTSFSARRRTARDRVDLGFSAAYSKVEGDKTTDNQRVNGRYDLFLYPRFYITPLGVEAYRDRFQNIDSRITPFTGVGYAVIDRGDLEWEVSLGAGYRFTRFDSVGPGEDDTDETATGIVGTLLEADLTPKVDLLLSYSAQIGLPDTKDTNQNATAGLSVDVWGDLDLDVKLVWDRIGDPEVDSGGQVPERDDYRLIVGLSLTF